MTNRNLMLECCNSIEEIKDLCKKTFLQRGFPTSRDDSYKYTNMKKYYKNFFDSEDFILTDKKQFAITINEFSNEYIIELSPSDELEINNKTDIRVEKLKNDDIDIIRKVTYPANSLSILNNAISNPVLIELNPNITKPIKIQYSKLNSSKYLMPNIIFKVPPNSNNSFNIINEDIADEFITQTSSTKKNEKVDLDTSTFLKENIANNHFLNTNIAFWIGNNSKIRCNMLQCTDLGIDINNISFYLKENSRLHFNNIITKGMIKTSMFIGENSSKIGKKVSHNKKDNRLTKGNLLRNNILGRLDGERSCAYFNGLYYCKNKHHIDNSLTLEHLQPNTFSNQFYKGIVTDYAKGIFNGKIYVEKEAQKTNAFQLNKVLVTSKNAKARSKPDLEIYADDVKCSHGATIGNLDLEQLFYLSSRGLDAQLAKRLIVEGFVNEIIERFDDPIMERYARNQFGNE